jgi:uncharacterized protein
MASKPTKGKASGTKVTLIVSDDKGRQGQRSAGKQAERRQGRCHHTGPQKGEPGWRATLRLRNEYLSCIHRDWKVTGGDDPLPQLRSSRYNFWVPLSESGILYNARSGAAMRLAGDDATTLARLLAGPPRDVDCAMIPESLSAELRRGGFLIERDEDELASIRERYWEARGRTPMVLTLTTTQDCNLGCYYCYESRSKAALESRDIADVTKWTKARLVSSGKDSLHVDWYGGEPLLNLEFLETASGELQRLCAELNVSYSASIISNGTRWPSDVGSFIRRNRIRQVQISFDGLKSNHDKRRRYRRGYLQDGESSSFEQAVSVVDRLLDFVRVDVRFNADRGNQGDLEDFVEFCKARRWFAKPFPCVFQLARISHYSERSDFLSEKQISEDEFETLRQRARSLIPDESNLDETTSRSTYPLPRTSVCAALAMDSVVVGAEGHHYRCGLQVGEKNRAVMMRDTERREVKGPDFDWWEDFDPTLQPNCGRCSFLPICWGGCPKKHLERDSKTLHEQSLFWTKALPQKIAWQFGVELKAGEFSFSERDQFRLDEFADQAGPVASGGPSGRPHSAHEPSYSAVPRTPSR